MKVKPNQLILTISRRALLAMQTMVSADESRQILTGVNIEVTRSGKVTLVATNDRYLAVLQQGVVYKRRQTIPATPEEKPQNIVEPVKFTAVIPSKLIANVGRSKESEGDVGVIYDAPELTVTFSVGRESVTTEVFEGNYPSWRQVIPTSPLAPLEPQFNWEYLEKFMKLAKILRPGKSDSCYVKLRAHRNDSGVGMPYSVFLTQIPYFYGVIMPLREEEPTGSPSWVTEQEEPTPAVAGTP